MAQATLRAPDPEANEREIAIRREKLTDARFMVYKAVEQFFFGLSKALEALWGNEAKKSIENIKKAA